MFISKYEKEKLQQKVEDLSLLVTQATDRANKSEEKISALLLKLTSIEEIQIQQRRKAIEVAEEIEDIEGLSDEITTKIATCDLRIDGLEKFFAARYRHYEEMEEKFKASSKENQKEFSNYVKRLDNFIDRQNVVNSKVEEQLKILANDQKMKYEKVLAVERLLEVTRAVLFGLKKDVAISKKDFNDLCKIAVTRDDPVFTLTSPEAPTKADDKEVAPPSIKLEAPWGYKKDGTPRKRPGRPLYKIPEIKNEQPLPV
jgi:chromosome segregation ATPase